MKVLYALQATGNGHISRANEILPILETMAHVDILLSGTQADVGLNHTVKFHKKGISFVFGKKGGIDYYATLKLIKRKQFLQEMQSIPVEEYDFVINDFEPLSAWACRIKKNPCVALSHQYAVIGKKAPTPKKIDPMAWFLLNYYAPCSTGIGFHFENYNSYTLTPVIRSEIRNAYVRNMGHYTVYLPAYSDKKIIKVLSRFKNVQWQVFSKHSKKSYSEKNCWIRPINNHEFISSITTSQAVLCGAGFETPAEALYMKKKLLVIPMKGQYEQHCNAAGLKKMGVPVLKKLSLKHQNKIAKWINNEDIVPVNYCDNTKQALKRVFEIYFLMRNPLRSSTNIQNTLPILINKEEFAEIA